MPILWKDQHVVSNLERYNGRFLCVKWSCSGNHSCSVEAEVYLKGLSCLLPRVIVVKAILVGKTYDYYGHVFDKSISSCK